MVLFWTLIDASSKNTEPAQFQQIRVPVFLATLLCIGIASMTMDTYA